MSKQRDRQTDRQTDSFIYIDIQHDFSVHTLLWCYFTRLQPEGFSGQTDKNINSVGKKQKQIVQQQKRGLLYGCKVVIPVNVHCVQPYILSGDSMAGLVTVFGECH